jgi:polar amino acid transport system substrate-binding protein
MARRTSVLVVAAVAALGTVLGACSPSSDTTTTGQGGNKKTSPAADACAKSNLQTYSKGKLTMATDQPVYPPWFADNKPQNGKGFEGAVAKAVATKMGFSPSEVVWTRVHFNDAIKPGPKQWDFDINEFSITAARKQAVDFSSSYYDVTQAVVTTTSSKAAKAKSLADLKGLQLGAQIGTTSYDAIKSVIGPSKAPRVFHSNNDALKALEIGSIDALVTDLPTAFYMTGAQLDHGKIVGQLPPTGSQVEQFGLVLDKGSPLTTCVSQAVDALRSDGTLQQISDRWLSQAGGAPVLK